MKKKGSLKDIVNRVSIAIVEREQPLLFLDYKDVFGDTNNYPVFTECFLLHITALNSMRIADVVKKVQKRVIKYLFTI